VCSVTPADITTTTYNTGTFNALMHYLEKLNDYYNKVENKARTNRDSITKILTNSPEDKLAYLKLQDDYENESLNQLLKNSNNLGERCLEKDGRLIQQIDPVFQDPTESKIGRAHFLAPRKNLFGNLYPTYWFNICVIWLMSISLMVTLYFDVFKKILDLFGNIKFSKKK